MASAFHHALVERFEVCFYPDFFLLICCCLSGAPFAQNLVVGASVDPDGGGGVVLEYHTGGSFSEAVSNWPWATAIRFDTDSDLWAGAGVHQQFALSERFFVEARDRKSVV